MEVLAAMEQGIAVIAVRENHNLMRNDLEKLGFAKGKYFVAENYPEAVGIMTALPHSTPDGRSGLKAGVPLESVVALATVFSGYFG
jgi:hypothetical protein